ncbi:hypothetical protein ACP4OV_000588 [Aristida adscensionis]
MSPPLLCDFEQWIDTEMGEMEKGIVARQRDDEKYMKELIERKRAEREREEEVIHRREQRLREEAMECEADRERKRERARLAKEALAAGGEKAVDKGKWPRCTQ